MLQKITIFSLLCLCLSSAFAYDTQDDPTLFGYQINPYGPKPQSITFSLFAGVYTNGVNQNFPQGISRATDIWRYGLRLGYQFDRNWSIESQMGYTPTIDNNFDLFVYDFSVSAGYDFLLSDNFAFYGIIGPGAIHNRTPNVNNFTRVTAHYGLGIKFFAFKNMNIRLEALGISSFDPANTAFAPSIGIQYYFQSKQRRFDQDGDGILDDVDRCPFEKGPLSNQGCPEVSAPVIIAQEPEESPFEEPRDLEPQTVDTQSFVDAPLEDHQIAKEEAEKIQEQILISTTIVDKDVEEFSGTVDGIHFNVGKSDILIDSYAKLNKGAEIFKKYPDLQFVIEGHTDSTGSLAVNMRLSKERAESVRTYLMSQGIDGSRMSVKAIGPERPIANNDTADGRARNRRIEFHMLNLDEVKNKIKEDVEKQLTR